MPGYALGSTLSQPVQGEYRMGIHGSPSKFERLYNASGLMFQAAISSVTAGYSDFDNMPIYKDIKLCNVVNGKVTAYENEPGFSRTPTAGDVMVEIPKYYYKVEKNGDSMRYSISDKSLRGFNVSPRHAPHPGNLNGYEKIYVSAYLANSGYRSISGSDAKKATTFEDARNGFMWKGKGYSMYDVATHWTILFLLVIEIGSFDAQSHLGYGNTYSIQYRTGEADILQGHSGSAGSTISGGVPKYRNIESLWGDNGVYCDGLAGTKNRMHINLNPSTYSDISQYNQLNYYNETMESGGIVELGFDERYPWIGLPIKTNAKVTSVFPYCDYSDGLYSSRDYASRFVYGGQGNPDYKWIPGMFFLGGAGSASNYYSHYFRGIYLPEGA